MIMISTPLKRDYVRGGKADKRGWLENTGKRVKTQREGSVSKEEGELPEGEVCRSKSS